MQRGPSPVRSVMMMMIKMSPSLVLFFFDFDDTMQRKCSSKNNHNCASVFLHDHSSASHSSNEDAVLKLDNQESTDIVVPSLGVHITLPGSHSDSLLTNM